MSRFNLNFVSSVTLHVVNLECSLLANTLHKCAVESDRDDKVIVLLILDLGKLGFDFLSLVKLSSAKIFIAFVKED